MTSIASTSKTMSNKLSGEKMVLAHSKTNYELPPVGVKEFEPNHSWLEEKQIQSALDNRKTLLETERIEKESNLMTADWRAEKRKAAVSRRGKHWETFGHHADGADWLFPEEAVFLMEMNCLECLFGEVPLSIQKGYSVLINPENGCSLDEYRVFAHLCRAGYRVLRHLPNLTVTAYERTIRLDQHLKERKTYDVVMEDMMDEETIADKTQVLEKPEERVTGTKVSNEPEEMATDETQVTGGSEKISEKTPQLLKKVEETDTDKTQVIGGPEKISEETPQLSKKMEKTVTDKTHVTGGPDKISEETPQLSKKMEKMVTDKTHVTGGPDKISEETPQLSKRMEKSVTDKTQVTGGPDKISEETPQLSKRMEKSVTDKTQVTGGPDKISEETPQLSKRMEKTVTDKTQVTGGPEKISEETPQLSNIVEETVTYKTQVIGGPEKISEETPQLSKIVEETVTHKTPNEPKELNCIGGLTKRQLRKVQRKKAKEMAKLEALQGKRALKKAQKLKNVQRRRRRRWLWNVMSKYKPQLAKHMNPQDQQNEDIGHNQLKKIRALSDTEDETPEIPSERWQPPVVISDLPENIEMIIGSTPVLSEESVKDQETVEIIDIADTSSEEEVEIEDEVESDSDIEIIREIRPQSYEDNEEEEDEDEDDLEIIEVPVPKKEIIVETLSSDSEEEEEQQEDRSGSDSERSYDGNWKRSNLKKKNKFVRPPTMSHLTFAAVDEFCAEKKLPKDNVNGEGNTDIDNNGSEFIGLESFNARAKRPVSLVEKTRNEILDLMPTMAGQNRKLMTLDSPDLWLVPDNIIPKQQSYTYSTNALRARVFRQGFRGRRNFHGPRFTSFNPYYNNSNGNFYPNQLSIGGPQALFQAPHMTQLLGGGDISSVARGVMQIASALLMNMPQNNVNNGILPYNPRPHFPIMNPNFSQIEPSNIHTPHFPLVNQNFSYNEPSNMNHRGFNMPQRNNSNFQNLFDMPQQRNFGPPNHIRFSDNSSSPVIENNQSSQNFNVDPGTQSSGSDFDSSDHNFTPPIGNSHSAGRNFRSNRAANFRSKRGRFQRKHQNHRGGFSQRNSRRGTSHHPQWIDPAYIKPDVPIPGEQNPLSLAISDFISISPSNSNQTPESSEVISIDDNDDGFVPRGGVSNRFDFKRKRMKRKLMRLKEIAKKKCLNINSKGRTNPEIVFLDSPSASVSSVEDSTLNSVKQENETDARVKIESLKQEETPAVSVKRESVEDSRVKVENEEGARGLKVKTEEVCGENSGVRVKVEHRELGQNVRVEIRIESSSDTSSVMSLPLANLVKEEPRQIKEESEVKTETMDVVESVKTEILDEQEFKEGIVETTDANGKVLVTEAATSERTQVEPMDTCASESERAKENENESVSLDHGSNCEVEEEGGNDIDGSNLDSAVLCSRTELTSEDVLKKKVSSWAEIKKNNLPLSIFQDPEVQDEEIQAETVKEDEDEEEIRPILRPKHCKTIGSVLSALQIFTPFTGPPPEDVLRLKISFDLYLPTEFRKSHRGLPQYRIVVFSGSERLPSPAQLREVNARFQDRVPVLTAVVAPGSVVFYTFTDVDLPLDAASYSK